MASYESEVDPGNYQDEIELDFLGSRVRLLDLSREVSTTMPIYPGHVGVAFWDHLTHEQVRRQRLPEGSTFKGYAVRGLVASEHVSTHVDAVWHFNPERPDLTIDRVPFGSLVTPGVWIDVSDVAPAQHITLDRVKLALAESGSELGPGVTLLYYTGWGAYWDDPFQFVSGYPGLDRQASEWILDQGVVNVCTDAPSTDSPLDTDYPNHQTHGTRCVIHTEMVHNITRLPRDKDFWVMFMPLRLVGGTGSPARAVAMWKA